MLLTPGQPPTVSVLREGNGVLPCSTGREPTAVTRVSVRRDLLAGETLEPLTPLSRLSVSRCPLCVLSPPGWL